MSIDYTILASELLIGHPVTGAYDADDQLAANELNALNIEVERVTTSSEAQNATDATEFNALPEADKSLWVGALAWDTGIDLNQGIGLATAQGIWAGAAGTITRPALIATRTELVSRVSQISFGRDTVTVEHVTAARAI
jgi:hypothetical protein